MPNKKVLPVVVYANIKHNIGNGKPNHNQHYGKIAFILTRKAL